MGRFLRSVSTDTVDPRHYKNYQEHTSAGSYSFTVPAGVRASAPSWLCGRQVPAPRPPITAATASGTSLRWRARRRPGRISWLVTVGAATADRYNNNAKAGNGGTSSVGSLLSATGGQGADGHGNSYSTGGTGGTGTGGTLFNRTGGTGGRGSYGPPRLGEPRRWRRGCRWSRSAMAGSGGQRRLPITSPCRRRGRRWHRGPVATPPNGRSNPLPTMSPSQVPVAARVVLAVTALIPVRFRSAPAMRWVMETAAPAIDTAAIPLWSTHYSAQRGIDLAGCPVRPVWCPSSTPP